jgi:hypothetical protein
MIDTMRRGAAAFAAAFSMLAASLYGLPAAAQSDAAASAPEHAEPAAPDMPPILPLRERAPVIDRILEERLDTVVPAHHAGAGRLPVAVDGAGIF